MKETKIEWCDSTVNPTDFQCCGCELWTKHRRDCYAGRFAERRGGKGAFDKPVVLKPGRMAEAAKWSDLRGFSRPNKPWLDGRPRVIFVGDMADIFQPDVPLGYLYQEVNLTVCSVIGRRHLWMMLTKQAQRLVEFAELLCNRGQKWPENLWPGVSVTSERTTWRIDELLKVPSDHRFISYEPAWEYVDFSRWTCSAYKDEEGFQGTEPSCKICMIIVGGESGPGSKEKFPFNIHWAKDAIDLCESDQVDCFVKQMGSNVVCDNQFDWPEGTRLEARRDGFAECQVKLKHAKGGDWNEWPEELRVRQFPET